MLITIITGVIRQFHKLYKSVFVRSYSARAYREINVEEAARRNIFVIHSKVEQIVCVCTNSLHSEHELFCNK